VGNKDGAKFGCSDGILVSLGGGDGTLLLDGDTQKQYAPGQTEDIPKFENVGPSAGKKSPENSSSTPVENGLPPVSPKEAKQIVMLPLGNNSAWTFTLPEFAKNGTP
jgi:hypothetical protein